jgi:hypothetical protein
MFPMLNWEVHPSVTYFTSVDSISRVVTVGIFETLIVVHLGISNVH